MNGSLERNERNSRESSWLKLTATKPERERRDLVGSLGQAGDWWVNLIGVIRQSDYVGLV